MGAQEKAEIVKKILLYLLSDADVRREAAAFARGLPSRGAEASGTSLAAPQESAAADEKRCALEQENQKLREEKAAQNQKLEELAAKQEQLERERKDSGQQLLELQGREAHLARELAQEKTARENEQTRARQQLEDLQGQLARERAASGQEIASLRAAVAAKAAECETLERKRAALEAECGKREHERAALAAECGNLQDENGRLTRQLAVQLGEAWDIRERYLSLPPSVVSTIEPLVRGQVSFEAFVCSCAQAKCLGFVWDGIWSAIKGHDQRAEGVLRELFKLSLRLVNAARQEGERYALLTTQPQDAQDERTQSFALEGRAQGRVQEVLLVGYQNLYTKKLERKSWVRLG